MIKVEAPRIGDEVRLIPPYYPGHESHYFLAINRNKRSVVVDMKQEEGRAIILDLASHCDVVVENFRPQVLDRLGLSFASLTERNPSLILVSISGFGRDGPLADKPSFDLVTQARSGVMSITGEPDGPPTKMGIPMGDLGGGLWGAIAVLAALCKRNVDPSPQHVDLSLLDGLISLLGYLGQVSMLTGEVPERVGSGHHHVAPYGRFAVKDGHIVIALHVGSFWHRFCKAIGRDDLLENPSFRTTDDRRANRKQLQEIVAAILRERTTTEWEAILTEADIPFAPILNIPDALAQAQIQHRQLLQSFDHPRAGNLRVVGSPVRFVGSAEPAHRPPPLLGEHTREILSGLLGYRDERIAALIEKGVVDQVHRLEDRQQAEVPLP